MQTYKPTIAKCPRCHAEVLTHWEDCDACGARLPADLGQRRPPSSGNGGWKIAFGIWNLLAVLFLVLAAVAGGSAANDCTTDASVTYVDACQAGAGIGASVLLGGVLFVTLAGNAALGVGYAIFGKKAPQVIIMQGPRAS